jgi:MFS family permease
MSKEPAHPPTIDALDGVLVAGGVPGVPPAARPGKGVKHSLRAFRHRDFAIFWCGALASNTGGWLSQLAVPYVLYQLTGSALWVALVSVAQFLPGIFLSPAAGALADRCDRRRVLICTQVGMSASALLLWAAWASGWRQPAVILLLVSLSGVFSGINMPSWQAFVADLVARPDLLSAVTLNSLQFNAARSLGPALAGLILAVLGPTWAFLLNGVSFVFVLFALTLVRAQHVRVAAPSTDGVGRQFLSTLTYIRSQPGIVISLVVSMAVGVLGNPIFQFTVVFAGSVFHVGPVELGCLLAALGVGAVIAAPLVSGWNHRLTLAHVVRWGLFLYGLAIIGFGLAPGYVAGLVALVLVGGSFLAVISAVNTSIQIIVADRMRGRVMAARIMIVSVSFPLGGVVQGLVSDRLGPRTAVVGAGVLMLVFAAVVMRWRSDATLDRLNDLHDEADDLPASTVPSHRPPATRATTQSAGRRGVRPGFFRRRSSNGPR